jgi:hypothetical protein
MRRVRAEFIEMPGMQLTPRSRARNPLGSQTHGVTESKTAESA